MLLVTSSRPKDVRMGSDGFVSFGCLPLLELFSVLEFVGFWMISTWSMRMCEDILREVLELQRNNPGSIVEDDLRCPTA